MKIQHINAKKALQTYLSLFCMLSLSIGLGSCGKSSFTPVDKSSQTDSPGSFSIPAKMDILLAVDNTGSALDADIRAPLLQFLKNLDSQNWDFRVGAIGVLNPQSITQVAVSKHDTKYGNKYVAPYAGAPQEGSSLAVFPADLYLPGGSVSNGAEPGILSMVQTLENEAIQMHNTSGRMFLRSDATTVVIVISTGEDTSEGRNAPVDADLMRRIREAKGSQSAGGTKVYAFVNTVQQKTNCLVGNGGVSYRGSRYMQLASATGGKSYDVCTTPVTQLFSALNADINSERINYISEYVFINQVPDLTTVVITKTNADGSTTIVPRSAWSYIEGQSTLPSISYPIPLNYRTGYAFKLSGSYVLKGNEKASVSYKVRGLQNSQ